MPLSPINVELKYFNMRLRTCACSYCDSKLSVSHPACVRRVLKKNRYVCKDYECASKLMSVSGYSPVGMLRIPSKKSYRLMIIMPLHKYDGVFPITQVGMKPFCPPSTGY